MARKHKHKHKRHHRGGGSLGRFLPPTGELIGIGAAFAYGKLEEQADKDKSHFLNQVPAVLPQLGRAGNAALLAWLLGVVTRKPIIKDIARGALSIAAYQQARGKGFAEGQQNFVMGSTNTRRAEVMLENYLRSKR